MSSIVLGSGVLVVDKTDPAVTLQSLTRSREETLNIVEGGGVHCPGSNLTLQDDWEQLRGDFPGCPHVAGAWQAWGSCRTHSFSDPELGLSSGFASDQLCDLR